ncbi:MAG: hypothetical protein ACQETL_15500 [Bacteroidota bacterium]
MDKLDDQKSDYEKMVSSWISNIEKNSVNKKEQKKRILELCHIASFAIGLKNREIINDVKEIDLVELSVEPDFIISFQNQRFGLEVRRVVNDKVKEIGEKRGILNASERIFEQRYPGTKALVNISFKDSFDLRTTDVETIKNQIADFVYSQITGGQVDKPEFVNRARCVTHSHLTFNLSGAYWVGDLDKEIKQGIKDKDKKIENYKTKMDLEKVWLLLVVSGASPESDLSHFDETTFVCDNSFDSVFLLNDFKKKVYFLTKEWN